jgi:hypothetical protein
VRHSTIRITPPSYDFGTVVPGTLVSTNFEIHNDGDTVLLLTNLTLGNGFTLSGFTPGEKVLPGDSVMVTVSDSAQIGNFATTMIANGTVPCTDTANVPLEIVSSSFAVAATGYNFGSVYVCQDSVAFITATDLGSKSASVVGARILDSLGTSGASQFKFSNGGSEIGLDTLLTRGQSLRLTLTYTPKIAGDRSAWIAITFEDAVTHNDTVVYQPLAGNPLHFVNTLSVKDTGALGIYTAYPGQTIDVPVQMNSTFNSNSGIYSIQFTLRYHRDMFVSNANPVVPDGGLQLIGTPTTISDPSDPNYLLTTVTVGSTSVITQIGTIAHLQLEYVLSKDSVSTLQVMNPVYFDQSGASACWVAHDTIPSAFAGLDRCGDVTLHTLLVGGTVSFHVQQITPNPVSGQAKVGLNVHLSGVPLTMEVYNILGQKEQIIMEEQPVEAGDQTATFETSRLQSGQYVLRVSDGTTVQSVPFVVQK